MEVIPLRYEHKALRMMQRSATVPAMTAERATSLGRALGLMEALGADEVVASGGCGVNQLATLLGRDKSQVSRMLTTLARAGFVERDPRTRRYRLGWQLFALAARSGDQRLLAAAGPVLVSLVRETGESVHLSVLRGGAVLTVLTESSPRALQAVSWVGRLVPVSSTSAGRALTMDHDLEQLRTLVGEGPWEQATPKAPADLTELLARVRQAVALGYARVEEESEPGLVAVAAPVRDAGGRIVAAVNLSAPRFRLGRRLTSAGAAVASAAEQVGAVLAGPATPLAEEALA